MESSSKSTLKNAILSGALTGTITAFTFQPFEYIKTRLQQPYDKNNHSHKYNNKIKNIIRNALIESSSSSSPDGKERINLFHLSKFWTGLSPSLLRSVPVAGIYFGCIDTFKKTELFNHSNNGGRYQIMHSFLIGSLSKVIADVSTFPLSLIKTRFESDIYNYKGVLSAFRTIIKNEGFLSLFKGLQATLARDISYSGIYFTLYTKIKSIYKTQIDTVQVSVGANRKKNETSLYFATCALFSAFIACGLTQPPDVIRSYMQLSPNKYKTIGFTIKYIYLNNGLKGFMVGFIPRSTRRILISVLSWTLYEKLTLPKS